MERFRADHKAVLDDMLLGRPEVRAGTMFGFPAYYVGRRLCMCVYEVGVGVKLPEPSAASLLASDACARPFQPLGRQRMREWIEIDLECSEDYRQYGPVFDESIRYALASGRKGER